MGEKNNAMCEYLSKPEVFADFVNVGYFHGKKEIRPEYLKDSGQISYEIARGKAENRKITGEGARSRDVVKVDRRSDKTKKKTVGKLSTQEFLSGIRKTDKLNPVITIVFYHGKGKYDGCLNLRDMLDLEGENSIFKPYTADYKMNLITLDDLEEEKCVSGLRDLIGFLKCGQSKEKLQEYCHRNKERIRYMDEDTYNTISVMLDRQDLLEVKEQYRIEEGGKVNMCKAMEDWAEELLQEGTMRGLSQGIEAFIAEFREEKVPDDQIMAKVMKGFSLTEAEAGKYLK